jgi:hypothetical protein
MIILRAYQKGDFDKVKLTRAAQKMVEAFHDFEAIKRAYDNLETLFTYEDSGEIICIWGWVPMWVGVAELVLFAGENLKNYMHHSRFLKRAIAKDNLGYDRLQMTVRTDPDHVRIAEFLGFEREGLLRKYVNGYDYYCYSRIN